MHIERAAFPLSDREAKTGEVRAERGTPLEICTQTLDLQTFIDAANTINDDLLTSYTIEELSALRNRGSEILSRNQGIKTTPKQLEQMRGFISRIDKIALRRNGGEDAGVERM